MKTIADYAREGLTNSMSSTATSMPVNDERPSLERLVESLEMRLVGLSNTVKNLEDIADKFTPCDSSQGIECNSALGLYGRIDGMQCMVSAIEDRICGVIGRL